MMLKELELVNMRSHREARIAFSSGITLFEGDIGSGKSSILMAVEFALFGLGSQKPEALLTKGEGSGSVKLRFEVDGKRYEIKRQLKRSGGRVGQDKRESYLLSGSVLENLAPSELKERVLEILGFNEPKGPRAGSRIFRYAVYTPQDEMKRVLSDAKERLETVRKAFAMEAYDTARDNIKVVKGHIDMEAARLEGRFAGMSELESRVAEAKREIDGAAAGLAGAEAARDAAAADESRLRADHDRLRGREAERERLRERAGSLRGQADGAAARGESARGQAAAKSAELAELEGRIGRHAIPPRPTERDDAGIAAEIGRLRSVQEDLNGAEGRVGILRRHLADADKKLAAAADPAAEAALAAGAEASRAEASRAASLASAARAEAAADESRLRADHDRLRRREAERERLRERAGSLRGQADGAAARGESARGQAAAKSAELAELEGRIGRHAIPPRPTERDDAGIAAEIGRLRSVQEDLNGAEGRVGILRRHLADADKKLAAAADPAAEAALAAGAAAAESRAQAEAELSAVLAQADGALQASSRVSSSLVQVKTEKAQAEKELARIAGLGTKCHTCESVLTPEHVERIRGEREAAIRARGSEAARLDAEQARLDAEQAALKSRRAALESRLEEAAEAERAAAEARQERERAAAERASKASELARAESEAAALREMYATDRAADRFECDDADPVGYLIKLREALAERAGAQAALEAMREKAELYRGDIRARRADAQRADADAQRARSELDAAEASLGAFGGLDAELSALEPRRAALEGRLEEAAEAERAAAEAERAAAEAERAAAEASQERERAAAERASKASELARAESEAGALREMYATDRAADRFECDDADPVGYLIKLREALAERAGAQAALEAMREKAELYRGDIRARRADAQRADADAQRARSELDAAEASLGAFGGLDAELDAAASRLDGARARLRSADAEAAAHRESLGGWKRRLAADEDLLARASKSMELHKRYDAYSRWFDLYFAPSVDRIERQVLLSLQAGFDEAYQKWFDTLIDDETKTSRIDDTFMPVVDQGSYEIDAAHLSGGERTSVSLAYRLALNTLLRRETKSLRSNLIILDEPTDGFSKSQLDKVHAILRALDYEQIIVVSHDRELETHADHVFHVSKEGGVSAVRAA